MGRSPWCASQRCARSSPFSARAEKMEDRSRKVEVREKLLVEIDSVVPLLRQHVLRIGMHKNQLTGEGAVSPTKSSGGGVVKNNGAGPGTHAHKITSLFTHKAVEEAHKTVEDCRERLLSEQLFRRAKVERRLEKEEAREAMEASTRQQLSDIPAYSSVLHTKGQQEQHHHHHHHHSAHSESPARGKLSPERNDSPRSKSSSRSPSPLTDLTSPRRRRRLRRGAERTHQR